MIDADLKDTHPYQIKICGHLSSQRVRLFTGWEIMLTPDGHTILTREAIDQAALFGTLIRIRDAGMVLLSVNRFDFQKGDRQDVK